MSAEIIPFARSSAANHNRAAAMEFLDKARVAGFSVGEVCDFAERRKRGEPVGENNHPAINALPFVETKLAGKHLLPSKYWCVQPTGADHSRSDSNRRRARRYAALALDAMMSDGKTEIERYQGHTSGYTDWLLAHIVHDMFIAEKAAARKRDKRLAGRLAGMREAFFQELGELILKRSGVGKAVQS